MDAALQSYSATERLKMLTLGLVHGNPVFLNYLRNNQTQFKRLQKTLISENLLEVCRHGSEQSIRMLGSDSFVKLRDERNNSCAHEAARYGNVRVLKELAANPKADFNSLNDQHETPLTYSLKNNLRRFEKVTLFLAGTYVCHADRTDLSIRDANHRLPF